LELGPTIPVAGGKRSQGRVIRNESFRDEGGQWRGKGIGTG
jgi:hypothetical protein